MGAGEATRLSEMRREWMAHDEHIKAAVESPLLPRSMSVGGAGWFVFNTVVRITEWASCRLRGKLPACVWISLEVVYT